MNNKGYMLYELIIAFVLSTIIAVFLLNTAFKLNDKNQELIISSRMNVIQEDFTSRFYEDADSHMNIYLIGSATIGNDSYCSFFMSDMSDEGGKEVRFGINTENNSIYYGDYETELPDGIVANNIFCGSTYVEGDDVDPYTKSIFHNIKDGDKNTAITVMVDIEDKYLNKNYDINILYLYQDMSVTYNEE